MFSHTSRLPAAASAASCSGQQAVPSVRTQWHSSAHRRQAPTTVRAQSSEAAVQTSQEQGTASATSLETASATSLQSSEAEVSTNSVRPRTLAVPRLTNDQVLEALFFGVHEEARQRYHSFFSSEIGGITTEPALMMVHMDDHMVHRGHAVFDTAILVEGYLYLFDEHLQRFLNSARMAGLRLPYPVEQLRRIILETVAASKKFNGFVRFWLGGGRGGFGISPSECLHPSFYCIVTTLKEGNPLHNPGDTYLEGRTVKTTPVPMKEPQQATVKSNNYLPNVLNVIDAEESGVDYGIFVDEDGFIGEGPNMNVAVLTKDGELVIPPFDRTLAGVTAIRLMELLYQYIDTVHYETSGALKEVTQRPIKREEVWDAQEAMLIGSTTYVTSILRWDSKDVGPLREKPGIVSLVLRKLIKNDMDPAIGPRRNFTRVPYGVLTNMEE